MPLQSGLSYRQVSSFTPWQVALGLTVHSSSPQQINYGHHRTSVGRSNCQSYILVVSDSWACCHTRHLPLVGVPRTLGALIQLRGRGPGRWATAVLHEGIAAGVFLDGCSVELELP